jgi:RimJ/RimL family protein N-acetyltransferase
MPGHDWLIREVTPEDAEAVMTHVKLIADERDNGITYDSSAQFTITVEAERELIQASQAAENALWLVAVLPDGQVIGNSNCTGGKRARYGCLALGITVHRDWRDQGIGTALLQRMIDWCCQNPVVHRLELSVIASNARAIHVYEKLGFEREGVQRQALKKYGKFEDALTMAIIFDREESADA